MFAINNPLSAFGISWPSESSSNSRQQQESIQMTRLAPPSHTGLPNNALSYGSYGNIESSRKPEDELEDGIIDAAVGYEQGTSQPYVADRQRAMRVLTRKGQILDGNPYRLPGVPDGTEQEIQRTKDDFEVVYHSDALVPVQNEATSPPKLAVEAVEPKKTVQGARATAYLDDETLARLEGIELFPQEGDWDYVDDCERVPVSKFSPYDSDSPPKLTGAFRSFSKKLKGSFRRPARPEISAPLLDLRHEPDNPAGMPTVMGYAVPIHNPAQELAVRANNVEEAINLRRQDRKIAQAKPPKPTKRRDFEAPRPAPPRPETPEKPRKVIVVGSPDRMTQLGDFMDLQSLDSSSEDSYDQQREILRVRSLHPLRKPAKGKKVDTSKHSWMPPESAILPMPPKVTSQNDWHMSAEYPTVDNLFTEIDQQIADTHLAGYERDANGEDRYQRSGSQRGQAMTAADNGNDNDDEWEMMVDTFIQGGHTLWRATDRAVESTDRSTRREFRQIRERESCEEDEAAVLMARLEKSSERMKGLNVLVRESNVVPL